MTTRPEHGIGTTHTGFKSENGPSQPGFCTAEPELVGEWSCTAVHSPTGQFCTAEWPISTFEETWYELQ